MAVLAEEVSVGHGRGDAVGFQDLLRFQGDLDLGAGGEDRHLAITGSVGQDVAALGR